jgi:hypothetical protein
VTIVLDYSVLDHILRIEQGVYNGPHRIPLTTLRDAAKCAKITAWMSDGRPSWAR